MNSGEPNKKKFAIIVAGGSGLRMRAALPKQFILLNGKPLLVHTLERFISYNLFHKIVLVLPESKIECWQTISSEYNIPNTAYSIVKGGNSRLKSVYSGLCELPNINDNDIVAVHDGVRIFTNKALITQGLKACESFNNAIPCVNPPESFRIYDNIGSTNSNSINRSLVLSVQTPQFANLNILNKAFEKAFACKDIEFTDEASILEFYGEKIHIIDGLVQNIKITTPFDLDFANFLINKKY